MADAARLYCCLKCNVQVIICRKCDRGHRYCLDGCAALARKGALQRAGKAYRQTPKGKHNNAARQQAYRDRQKQIVTHQSSQEIPVHDVLQDTPKPPEKSLKRPKKAEKQPEWIVCHQCGCRCEPFVRLNFIHANRFVSKLLYQ